MIKDSTNELMEVEGVVVAQDDTNQWLQHLKTGFTPKPALTGRLPERPVKPPVSPRQMKGVKYGK